MLQSTLGRGVEVGGQSRCPSGPFRSNQKSETRDAGAQLSPPFLFSIQSETPACGMLPPARPASQIHPSSIPNPVRLSTASSEGDNKVLWDAGCPLFEHSICWVIYSVWATSVCSLLEFTHLILTAVSTQWMESRINILQTDEEY